CHVQPLLCLALAPKLHTVFAASSTASTISRASLASPITSVGMPARSSGAKSDVSLTERACHIQPLPPDLGGRRRGPGKSTSELIARSYPPAHPQDVLRRRRAFRLSAQP